MRYLYHAMILLIGAVSAYDNTMTWIYSDTIVELEMNPVGVWLMEQGGVSLFITVKAAATLLLVGVLFGLSRTKYRWLIIPTFVFQLGMFAFLNLFCIDGPTGMPVLDWGPHRWEKVHPVNEWIDFMTNFYRRK